MPPTATLEPSPVPPIDPRIRARRIEVRRVEGRRRLQRLLDLGLVALVGAGFVGALWTPLLDVDEVQVSGATRTGQAAVLEHAQIARGHPLVSVDLGRAGERVAALPWVREVHLARRVDGVVTVEITERTAVAVVSSGPQRLLVDEEGRVLGPAASSPDVGSVVALEGVGEVPAPGGFLGSDTADLLALAARVATAAPGALTAVRAEELTGSLAQGGEVRFGDARQLDAKLRSLRTVLDQVDLTCLAVLDLRLPGSPVLTREERCS